MQKNNRVNCRRAASFLVIQSKFFLKLLIVLLDLPSTLRQTLAVTSVSSLFCPSFYLLSHWLEVSLHSINSKRDAVDRRERFRVFREHRSEHAGDNVSRFGPPNIRFPRSRLPAHVDRALAMARHPHRGTEPFAFTFLTRLDRRLAPASRALSRNAQQLDPANSRGCNCFGGECRQTRAHRRFRLSPRKNSHRNECLDISRT